MQRKVRNLMKNRNSLAPCLPGSTMFAKQITCQEVAAVDVVIECILKVTIEKVLEALAEGHHQVMRAVMIIARRIALMIYFGTGL